MSKKVEELDDVVIKFAGDSGDGMQLTGTQFSNTTAFIGNDLATFPDFLLKLELHKVLLLELVGLKFILVVLKYFHLEMKQIF